MSKFITGKELEKAVDDIIWKAEEELLIVSPYIKLDGHFKDIFEKQVHNHKLHILILFGKNEGQVYKSFNQSDLEFFKQFPNISIVYVPKLHAKYYANEDMGVVTSINLYDYSFINNIEFGVLYEPKLLNIFSKDPDAEVRSTCIDLANGNDVVFIKRPIYAGKEFRGAKVLYDVTEPLYKGLLLPKNGKRLEEFVGKLDFDQLYQDMPSRKAVENPTKSSKKLTSKVEEINKSIDEISIPPSKGYCIRTGIEIPFNPERPMSYKAYQSWSKFSNEEYPEKFCHYSGEPSNGETSIKRPILYKNWKKAKVLKKY